MATTWCCSLGLPHSSGHLSWWLPQLLPPEPNTPDASISITWKMLRWSLPCGTARPPRHRAVNCYTTQAPLATGQRSTHCPGLARVGSARLYPLQLCALDQLTWPPSNYTRRIQHQMCRQVQCGFDTCYSMEVSFPQGLMCWKLRAR